MYLHNTSTWETQPGAMYVKWSLPTKVSRSTSPGERKVTVNERERYAGHVVYDKSKFHECQCL